MAGQNGPLDVGGPQERAALAVLAANVGEVVSGERLGDALWGDSPPQSAAKLVQNLVLRLRKAVGRDLIETRRGGYLLRVAPDAIDAQRFERLVTEAREQVSSGELAAAVASYSSSLALWRGRPLSELADWPAARAEVTRLEELHGGAEEEQADAALRLGRHREWVARLESLVTEEPLRERRWVLLIVALHRSGRRADALRAYQRVRAALGELGLEPGPELRATERAVSVDDGSLALPGPPGGRLHPLPTGVVTFLLTDVEGSSQLWERAPEAMAEALERHDALIEGAVTAAGGTLLKARSDGDATFSVFTRTSAAVAASVAARQALDGEAWPTGVSLGVRMGVHTGEAHERDGDYYGPTVNRAARLRDLGSGGQVLVSEAVATLIRDDLPAGWDLAELGEHALRGLTRPERLFSLVPSGATLGRDATVVARSCPYMGLLPFRTEDDRLFFGRDDVVAAMLDRLGHSSFLALVGASGTGKSSLLRAGLVARLERGDERRPWLTMVITPTSRPMAELAARLGPLCGREAAELLRYLEADPRVLDVLLRQAIASQAEGTRLALVVDQLEELFTQCHDEDERRRFLDALVDVGSAPDGRVVVVAALRSDFFGHGAAHKALAGMLETHSILLGAMDDEDLRATIEGPASVAGLTLEPGLADVILRDVTGEPGGLPLLSHALAEVWSRRQGRLLTIDGYRDCGGVAGAIARSADAVYERLDPDQQRVARDIFVRLTELGEGTEDAARRATVDELARDDPVEAVLAETVLRILAAARLVTTSERGVEVAHEALIREWPRLRGWLDEDRDGLRLMRHLTVAAHEWDQRGRDDSDLYRGARLAAAVEWSAGHREAINPRERGFLKAGRRLQDAQVREIAARNRRLRWLLAGTGVALVLALLAGTLAIGQRNRSSSARDRAAAAADSETVGRLVAQSRVAQSTDLDLALLLALEANRRSDTPETRGAVQSALLSNSRLLGFLHGSGAGYLSVSISPDGVIAAGTAEGTVDLWDGSDRRLVDSLDVGSSGVVAGFSPDGTLLAVLSQTSDSNSSLSLWDVATRRKIGPPLATAAAAVAYGTPFAFSADGKVLSGALASGEIATWDVDTRAETAPRLASADGAPYRAVAYSPDGRHLAAASEAGGVTVHDTRTRQPAGPALEAGSRASLVSSLGFDRQGTRLAAGSSTGAVYAWDLTTGKLIPLPSGPTPDVFGEGGARGAVAFSPHEDALATGFTNGVHVVDLANPDQPVPVPTQGGNVTSVAYSPDGAWITAANSDGSISIIDAAGRRKLGMPVPSSYQAVWFSPNGDLFAVPDYRDGSVVLVDPRDGSETRRLFPPGMRPIPPGAWPLPAFSANGTLLAYGGVTGHVTIFDVATGAVVQTLPAPPAKTDQALFPAPETYVGRLAFSPDGTKLVAASLETGAIFDLRSGSLIARPTGWAITAMGATFTEDGDLVVIAGLDQTLIFDPDTGEQVGAPIDAHQAVNGPGGTLVTADDSGTIRLVDLDSRKPVGPPMIGPQGFVVTLEVVPGEAELVATYGFAQIAQLFDIATGQPIGDPFPSQGPFGVASVSPDGKVLVAGDGTRVVHWNIDQATWPAIACEAAGRSLARAEWARFLPNAGPYRATCPDHPN